MPKFNENSSEANENSGRQLHFDIKQDAITFEGKRIDIITIVIPFTHKYKNIH